LFWLTCHLSLEVTQIN